MIHEQKDLAALVSPIMHEAGKLLLSYYHQRLNWKEKEGDNGFVTEADIASENFLIQSLTSIIPGASFFAEESGKSEGQSDYCWVIDPLDGTTNFAHGLPYFCISIALTHKNVPVFGVIYQPLLNELFYAQKGKGAWLNEAQLSVNLSGACGRTQIKTESSEFLTESFLKKSIIAIGLPYAKNEEYAYILENTWTIAREAYAIRHFGAVALDIAYVAAGRLDGVIFSNLGWWDAAAGMVILSEAGGTITDFQGNQVGLGYRSFIGAGSGEAHQRLLNTLKTTPLNT